MDNNLVKAEDREEFLGQIIDAFEDFLDGKGIVIHENRDQPSQDVTNIRGEDYNMLCGKLSELMENWGVF